ncbi:MAG: cation transporter [Leptolyngbyaceae bacterium]|nr:cation transporter [Leptolyngbyaceae bacterium]
MAIHSAKLTSTFEQRSLRTARWANLVMAIAGVFTAWISNADALLVDGLYSGVNFFSSIVAAKVGESVMRPWDKTRPFGYYADESLYVTFRSVVLLGILLFAAVSAIAKIIAYASGNTSPEIGFGKVVAYSIFMVTICLGVAYVHHYNWVKTHKQSDILKTEMKAAIVDGILSAGVGLAFGLAPLLATTPLKGLLPITDSIVVLILVVIIIKQPVSLFLEALAEIAGESAAPSVVSTIRQATVAIAETQGYSLMDVSALKLGRFHFILIYLQPHYPFDGRSVDQLRAKLKAICERQIGFVELEVVLTETPRLR